MEVGDELARKICRDLGWPVDLPGVNAQEKDRETLLESLKIRAVDILNMPVETADEEELAQIEV
jgi:hypothetical protein